MGKHKLLGRTLHDITSVRPDDLRLPPHAPLVKTCPEVSPLIAPAHSQVISIASGKGGTGKTVVATNLSVLLAREGFKVLLFDADLGLANAHLLLGASPIHDISQVLTGERKMKDIVVECLDGVQLVPGGSGFSELAELADWRFRYLARQFRELEEGFNLVFVDLSAGIGPQVMRFLNASHEIILVTTPDITALMDAYATIKSLAKIKGDVNIRLIINRVRDMEDLAAAFQKLRRIVNKYLRKEPPLPFNDSSPLGGGRIKVGGGNGLPLPSNNSSPLGGEDEGGGEGVGVRGGGVNISLFGWLPNNWYIQNSVIKRQPVVSLHPRSFVTRCFHKMARQIVKGHHEWERTQARSIKPDASFFAKLEQMVFK